MSGVVARAPQRGGRVTAAARATGEMAALTAAPTRGRRPARGTPADAPVAYHAARVLLVIRWCGRPQTSADRRPAIKGRTLLAKLDFFVRYPNYLVAAATIRNRTLAPADLGAGTLAETSSVESRMVRYRYGPWDHVYYVVLAYLIGKGLIVVEQEARTEVFRLTARGDAVAQELSRSPAYADVTARAKTSYRLFNSYSGNGLKDFIYRHFPEVVARGIGEAI